MESCGFFKQLYFRIQYLKMKAIEANSYVYTEKGKPFFFLNIQVMKTVRWVIHMHIEIFPRQLKEKTKMIQEIPSIII